MTLQTNDPSTVSFPLPISNDPSPQRAPINNPPPPTDIRTWFSNVEQHATEGVNKILIGNKCDWEEKRVVSVERGQQLADELGIPFMEVSAKSNINVEKAFYSLAADIKKRIIDTSKTEQGPAQGVNVAEQSGGMGGMGGKCC